MGDEGEPVALRFIIADLRVLVPLQQVLQKHDVGPALEHVIVVFVVHELRGADGGTAHAGVHQDDVTQSATREFCAQPTPRPENALA